MEFHKKQKKQYRTEDTAALGREKAEVALLIKFTKEEIEKCAGGRGKRRKS